MKLIRKRVKEAFDKGVAAGLGYTDKYYTEDGNLYASVYGGDMSSPSTVRFIEDNIIFERAASIFESLPLDKYDWEIKKTEILNREVHEEEFELLDIETGKKYYSDDPEIYGEEITYEIVDTVQALKKDDNEYTLFAYHKVKNVVNKFSFVRKLCEKTGYCVDWEQDSCYNRSYFVSRDGLKGPYISHETYDLSAIRYEEFTEIGRKIWKAKKITEEVKKAIEKEFEEDKKRRAAAAAAKKKYAAKVFSEAKSLGLNTTDIPSIRALSVLVNLTKGGFWLPPKTKAKLREKAYAWAYVEAVTPRPVWKGLLRERHLTFDEALWVLVNLPDPS